MAAALKLPTSLFRHLGMREGELAKMPARVARLVVAEEERSERLIGWVQLAITAIFAALYMIAPRPSDAMDAMFEPVPMVLTAYGAFTVVRLVAAYRGYLPGWLLVMSMLADVGLLYALIWTFHLAYAQPAPFYLKVPTFAYIFVFIAIRALRFDPRFVLSQGIFAATGWLLMFIYAIEAGGSGVITRSFSDYLTQNRVLVGAELDKIFTILLCAGVLSLALYRARRTLFDAVREGAARRDMGRFFGAGVADEIAMREDAAAPGDAVDRDAAVVMLDLRGFTAFASAHPPGAVVALLTEYHRRILPIIVANGGMVDKFLGDGIMATFGALKPSDTAAADAVRALLAVVQESRAWNKHVAALGYPPMPINGGAAAGRVVAATLGSDARLEFTVIGRAANLAAKLEKYNKEAGSRALTDAATLARAKEQGLEVAGRPLGSRDLAGGGYVDVVQLG